MIAPDGKEGDRFGKSVAIYGNFLLVGAYADDNNGENSGSVYFFEKIDDSWVERGKVQPSDAASFMEFGYSLQILDNVAVIGAPYSGPQVSGNAYVFNLEDNWIEKQILTPSDNHGNMHFGTAVAFNENFILVGAKEEQNSGATNGAAYVFSQSEDGWVESQKLESTDPDTRYMGTSVAIGVDVAVVGAQHFWNAGHAFIYKRIGNDWLEQTRVFPIDGEKGDAFGSAVAIGDEYVFVGAQNHHEYRGAVYVYKNIDGLWTQTSKIMASDSEPDDLFGKTILVSDSLLLIGASRANRPNTNTGAVYIFRYVEDEWVEELQITTAAAVEDYSFGCSISISDAGIVVGADNARGANDERTGAAYIYTGLLFTPDIPPVRLDTIADQYVSEDFELYDVARLDTVFFDPDSTRIFLHFRNPSCVCYCSRYHLEDHGRTRLLWRDRSHCSCDGPGWIYGQRQFYSAC